MTSFKQQIVVAKRLKLKEGDSKRLDCPFCLGKNTYGISLTNGILEWHCFKASCDVRGKLDEGSSINGLKDRLNASFEKERVLHNKLPDILSDISTHTWIIEYLKSVNSYEAYKNNLVDIKYAPIENRIMFGIKYGKTIVGYTGRSLTKKPKWKKFGDCSHLFTCGLGRIGVLIEDAPSACAVGAVEGYTGLSLLGTTLTSLHKQDLKSYDQIIICLDPDAASKSFPIMKSLDGIVKTTVRFIPDDLKYFNSIKIKEILEG